MMCLFGDDSENEQHRINAEDDDDDDDGVSDDSKVFVMMTMSEGKRFILVF